MKAIFMTVIMMTGGVAAAEVYKIDTSASRVEWKAGKKIGSFHNGDIKIKGGEIQTDKKGRVKGGTVVVDMKTIANEDLKEKPDMQGKLVGHLSSEDFFNAEKFPESTFKIKSIKPKEGATDEYVVTGDLTLIGKPQSISFPAKISAQNGVLTGQATLTIERLKWGLKYGSGSIFKELTADKIINDTFELTLNLVAKK